MFPRAFSIANSQALKDINKRKVISLISPLSLNPGVKTAGFSQTN
jgi:hypothetical protein